ncbi:MAG: D-alanine--D-alanine ligase [Desulfobulbaceae bacterium]|nr:D-alanine--D-alanine ligase [Desulfobulbaceae bacterium]
MRIAVLHNRVSEQDGPDAMDVLVQADTVGAALNRLGLQWRTIACTLDLEAVRRELSASGTDLVFNLVEDLDGHGRLIHLVPYLLDALGIAYTGAPAEAILQTSGKIMAKEKMRRAGLPTPAWTGPYPSRSVPPPLPPGARKWIIKSVWEHASIGLDDGAVVETDSAAVLAAAMRRRSPLLGGDCFAEEFIDGREFNLSLLTGPDGPEVLPPAEMVFEGYGPDMVRIVDYRAKWDERSFAGTHTLRRFDFPGGDAGLLNELRDIARRCWEEFSLEGYARVDFRVDAGGRPFILEINANPCLSPDAGFAAAAARAGLDFDRAVARIVAAAGER